MDEMATPRRRRNRDRSKATQDRKNARFHAPTHLQGASDWANDPYILSSDWLLDILAAQSERCQPVIDTATALLTQNWGPARKPGEWVKAYLCFVISRFPDMQPWLKNGTNAAFWRELGFEGKPPYTTVYDNFVAMEKVGVAAVFETGGDLLVGHARSKDEHVGRHVTVDGCEAETHGALIHDCKPGEGCPFESGDETAPSRRSGRGRGRRRRDERRRGPGARPQREHVGRAKEDREKENEEPPVARDPAKRGAEREQWVDGKLRVRVGKHWYIQTDTDAGRRTYDGPRGAKKFWCGYYDHAAEDNHCGGTLSIKVNSASRQEWQIYAELIEATIRALGATPEAVIGDKGFSVAPVFQFNTERGIASVFAWRMANAYDAGSDQIEYDRHGIPRCEFCGCECSFVRFNEKPHPRLWYRCATGTTEKCRAKTQSKACSRDWRTLLPLWRDDPIYHQLKEALDTHERGHDLRRDRFRVGGDNRDMRPKRMGIEVQRLRAQAARFIEWLAICDWNGWFDAARAASHKVVASGRHGARAHRGLMGFRARAGLTKPYGEQAAIQNNRSRWLLPPSERGRAGPPG
jgi:hypothetical protein